YRRQEGAPLCAARCRPSARGAALLIPKQVRVWLISRPTRSIAETPMFIGIFSGPGWAKEPRSPDDLGPLLATFLTLRRLLTGLSCLWFHLLPRVGLRAA